MAFVILPTSIYIAGELVLVGKLAVAALTAKIVVDTVHITGEITGKVICALASNNSNASNERPKEQPTIGDGKPTNEDGFVPKRNWGGKKTVASNGKRGYEDKDGDIWVPVKKSNHGGAHGGEHWDVQHRDGTYHNTFPGGKKAGGNCRHVKK